MKLNFVPFLSIPGIPPVPWEHLLAIPDAAFPIFRVNNLGEVAFTAVVRDPAGVLPVAIFLASAGGLKFPAAGGDPAPSGSGGAFALFRRPVSTSGSAGRTVLR